MPVPENPKIYHIVHVDRLLSIIRDGNLLCNSAIREREAQGENFRAGTDIGMDSLKDFRLTRPLNSHPALDGRPELLVGNCVPFYFCNRSIMLYVIYCRDHPSLAYREGQEPIIHLESDMCSAVNWAEGEGLRWAFTLANASKAYCEDRANWENLAEINWDAVEAQNFQALAIKEGKQAEFLVEQRFPWHLVAKIGVISEEIRAQVDEALQEASHKPIVSVQRNWYY